MAPCLLLVQPVAALEAVAQALEAVVVQAQQPVAALEAVSLVVGGASKQGAVVPNASTLPKNINKRKQ